MAKSGHISRQDIEQMSHSPLRQRGTNKKIKDVLMEEATKPVQVKNLYEIEQLIRMIMQHNTENENKEVTLSVEMEWNDEKEGRQKEVVSATTKETSMYGLLLDGMNVVKKYMQSMETIRQAIEKVEEKDDIPASLLEVWNIQRMHFNVDSFIHKKMGGKRNGLRIRWEVQDGIFEFDPYAVKLYKVEENADGNKNTQKT